MPNVAYDVKLVARFMQQELTYDALLQVVERSGRLQSLGHVLRHVALGGGGWALPV